MECKECLNLYNDFENVPRLLIFCGHSICEKCLIDSVSTKKEITCPECQQKSLINDVNEMPKNLALLNNHNPYISGTQDISLRSTIKNTDQVALEKIFRQNVDKSIESLSNRDEDIQKNENSCSQSRIQNTQRSSDHCCEKHGSKLEAYCNKDKVPICLQCILSNEHKGHEFISQQEAIDKEYNSLKKSDKDLQKYIKNISTKTLEIKDFEEKIDVRAQQKLNEIQKFFDIVLKLCKTKCEDLCSGVTNTLLKETEKYSKIRKTLETHVDSAMAHKSILQEYLNYNPENHIEFLYNVFQREKSIKDSLKTIDDIKFVNNIKDFNIHTEIKTLCQSISSAAVNFAKQSEKRDSLVCNKENILIGYKDTKSTKNHDNPNNLNLSSNLNSLSNSEILGLNNNNEKKQTANEIMGITKIKKDVVCGNLSSKMPLTKESTDESFAKGGKKHNTFSSNNFAKANNTTKASNSSLYNINVNQKKQVNSKREDQRKSRIKNTTRDASPCYGISNNSYLDTKNIKPKKESNKSILNDRRGEKKAQQNNLNSSVTPQKMPDLKVNLPLNNKALHTSDLSENIEISNINKKNIEQSSQNIPSNKFFKSQVETESSLGLLNKNPMKAVLSDLNKARAMSKQRKYRDTNQSSPFYEYRNIDIKQRENSSKDNSTMLHTNTTSTNNVTQISNPINNSSLNSGVIFDDSSNNELTNCSKSKIKYTEKTIENVTSSSKTLSIKENYDIFNTNLELVKQFSEKSESQVDIIDLKASSYQNYDDNKTISNSKEIVTKMNDEKDNHGSTRNILQEFEKSSCLEEDFDESLGIKLTETINIGDILKDLNENEQETLEQIIAKDIQKNKDRLKVIDVKNEEKSQNLFDYISNDKSSNKKNEVEISVSAMSNNKKVVIDASNCYENELFDNKSMYLSNFNFSLVKTTQSNSCIYVIGGYSTDPSCNMKVSKFCPTRQTWGEKKSVSIRVKCALVKLIEGDKCLIIGGKENGVRLNTFELLDVTEDRIQKLYEANIPGISKDKLKKCKLPCIVSGCAAVRVENMVYICGGNDGETILNQCIALDLNTWEIVILEGMLYPRDELALTVSSDSKYVYAIGGFGGNLKDEDRAYHRCLKQVERYCIKTKKWEFVSNQNYGRRALNALTLPDGIYAIGGFDGDDYLSSVECYDDINDKWIVKKSLKHKRCTMAAVTSIDNNYIYVMGGFETVPLDSVERYSVIKNEWVEIDKMPIKRFMHSAIMLNSK